MKWSWAAIAMLGCGLLPGRSAYDYDPKVPFELVESAPSETTLDRDDVPNADEVWISMIKRAKRSIDLATFYISNSPDKSGKLEPVLRALEDAADRGVKIRILVDETFYPKYPDDPIRLKQHSNVQFRRFDGSKSMGGILHAKYFVVDGSEAYVGSQNFDYRSLDHIHEIGIRTMDAVAMNQLEEIFQMDWFAAGGEVPPVRQREEGGRALGYRPIMLGASPPNYLPNSRMWDLPKLVTWIDAAQYEVRIEVLTYKTTDGGLEFLELDNALRRAANRGVRVNLLVSEWGAKDPSLISLAHVKGISVGIVKIPKHSSGDIPFARVIHAKYMVVDQTRAWVGTSNWEGRYFNQSRNVGFFVDERRFARKLAETWQMLSVSRYVKYLQDTTSLTVTKDGQEWTP